MGRLLALMSLVLGNVNTRHWVPAVLAAFFNSEKDARIVLLIQYSDIKSLVDQVPVGTTRSTGRLALKVVFTHRLALRWKAARLPVGQVA